ncbi:rhomboid family intramembrane serine protease [candidate division WWE3 bacterium]|nr:rhomboid family intramembrane serine protease [candidate division WWE3 bacterium]
MFPLRDREPSGIFPFLTYLIVVICAVVLGMELITPNLNTFFFKWALVPSLVDFSNSQTLYTFVTSMFLHGGFFHFASNMWFLIIFGDNVEADLGEIPFILFYLLGGVFAAFIQYLFLKGEAIPILGASGAIAAVLGYYMVKFPQHKVETLIPTLGFFTTAELPSYVVLGLWFATQLLNGSVSLTSQTTAAETGIAWWAHIGGFAFGIVVAVFNGRNRKEHNFADS